jgi:hypothetical protein
MHPTKELLFFLEGKSFIFFTVRKTFSPSIRRWLGEDLSVYSNDQDLREVDNVAIRNIVKGYAAFVVFPFIFKIPSNDVKFRLYNDEKRVWNRETFTDHFKLEGLGPTVGIAPVFVIVIENVIQVVGSPSTVADQMQVWVDEGDVDGFSTSPSSNGLRLLECVESQIFRTPCTREPSKTSSSILFRSSRNG